MLYAKALHEVMMNDRTYATSEAAINNGTAIIDKILGRKYRSMVEREFVKLVFLDFELTARLSI